MGTAALALAFIFSRAAEHEHRHIGEGLLILVIVRGAYVFMVGSINIYNVALIWKWSIGSLPVLHVARAVLRGLRRSNLRCKG